MRAVQFHEFGSPEVLRAEDVPIPGLGLGEVLVRMRAVPVAVGRDVDTRNGRHPIFPKLVTLPHILGGEFSGTVEQVAAGVAPELIGRRVAVSASVYCGACPACEVGRPHDCRRIQTIGIQRSGSYAELCAAPTTNLHELPDDISFVQAAILAANGPLAHQELELGRVGNDDTVLIPGASGAVGSLLVALASRRGAQVIALSRDPQSSATLRSIGAKVVLNPNDPELTLKLRSISKRGCDVVVDNVAAVDLWERYWPAVARHGRIIFAGKASGERAPIPLDVIELYVRRATIAGVALGDPAPVAAFWSAMRQTPLHLPPELIQTFPLQEAGQAHAEIEAGRKVGHFVLAGES